MIPAIIIACRVNRDVKGSRYPSSYDPECGWQMKRVLVASVAPMLLLAQFSDGFAAGGSGPFNGNWTGSATSTVEQCKSAKVTVTVEGKHQRDRSRRRHVWRHDRLAAPYREV